MAIDLAALQAIEDLKNSSLLEIDTQTDGNVEILSTATEGFKSDLENEKDELLVTANEVIAEGNTQVARVEDTGTTEMAKLQALLDNTEDTGGNATALGGKTRAQFDAEIESNAEQIQNLSYNRMINLQKDYFEETKNKYTGTRYYRFLDESTLEFLSILENGRASHLKFQKNVDDYWQGGYCAIVETTNEVINEYVQPTDFVGIFTTGFPPNCHTQEIGATMGFSFTGTGFVARHFANEKGGYYIYSVKDNGTEVAQKEVIVHSDFAGYGEFEIEIIKGLDEKTYDVIATFMGEHPSYPTREVAGNNTPTGWFICNLADPSVWTFKTYHIDENKIDIGEIEKSLIDDDAIRELAFSFRKETSTTMYWTPNHGTSNCFNLKRT